MPKLSMVPLLTCTWLALACGAVSIDDEGSGAEGPAMVETTGASSGTGSSDGSEATGAGSDSGSGTSSSGAQAEGAETQASTTGDGPGEGCDPLAQDCPVGEKCTFYSDGDHPDGTNACVPVVGKAQPGDVCTTMDDHSDTCVAGSLCWGSEPDGLCIEICDEDKQCSSGDPCTITHDDRLPLCLFVCDPAADGCPDGWSCQDDGIAPDGWFCEPT
jgi:hypothetical protein